ncbi:hypothetical protein ACJRO7_012921 [Eucalyptus globulus]|uniref:Uncharacterized protein n=1 Tax=Eucalyptus globulus TaxID=34317 RepID=A0ABD3LK41_EUCGL
MGADSNSAENAPVAATPDDVDALIDAARYGDMEDVTSLAAAGVPLDSRDDQGRTALHMAAANGHLSIVDYIISKGADVNAANAEKNTPLHWACLNGHVQVIVSSYCKDSTTSGRQLMRQ